MYYLLILCKYFIAFLFQTTNGLKYFTIYNFQVGHEFIKVLKEASSVKFKWDSEAQEHFIEAKYGGRKHTIFFPSLNSISNRILLAKDLGTGLSIWELGQGLDYFYDLL